MNNRTINAKQAKELIDLVDYLASLGHRPTKVNGREYWYCSPLREEKAASFKIDRIRQEWYDHGRGRGGNLIDFGILYHNCSVAELLQRLSAYLSFHQQIVIVPQTVSNTTGAQNLQNSDSQNRENEKKIKVVAVKDIESASLQRYLSQRFIPLDLAKRYCKEVTFELYSKTYTALVFENSQGGYELRVDNFKASSSPKHSTWIFDNITGTGKNFQKSEQEIAVFEGFFSFLSYKALLQEQAVTAPTLTNFLVLNSLAFLEKQYPAIDQYKRIQFFLDRDKAGIQATLAATKRSNKYIDASQVYRLHKDLNAWLVKRKRQPDQRPGRGHRL